MIFFSHYIWTSQAQCNANMLSLECTNNFIACGEKHSLRFLVYIFTLIGLDAIWNYLKNDKEHVDMHVHKTSPTIVSILQIFGHLMD